MERKTTKPKVFKVPMGKYGNEPLFSHYFGCGECGRSLDPSYRYCPECGRRILWREKDEH